MTYLRDVHNQQDYVCEKVDVIEEGNELLSQPLGDREKLTLIKRRCLSSRVKSSCIRYGEKKDSTAKILKLPEKMKKTVAVDDEPGLMAVLDTIADVKRTSST